MPVASLSGQHGDRSRGTSWQKQSGKEESMQQARIVLWMVIGLVAGGFTIVHAAEKKDHHDRMMGMVMRQLKAVLNPNHVLGEALDFDGTKVIPIVRMGFGLSARHSTEQKSDDEDEDDKEHGEEHDQDGEAGFHLRSFLAPVALLVVTKTGDVRVIGLPGGTAWRERTERAERPERSREQPPAPRQERQ